MEIRLLKYFLAVIREGSISSAADSLHITQPSLSRQLKDLEEKLNIVATYNLIYNASLMVEEGVGYALCLDKLINTTGNSNLCFRPLSPKLECCLDIVWKKHNVLSSSASNFLKRIQSELL